MPKVYGYIRVSTEEQADGGISLHAQRDALTAEFESRWKAKGYELGEIFSDPAVKGGTPFLQRPAGSRLAVAATRGDVILVPRIDRAFRNMRDGLATIETMLGLGIKPVFLDNQLDLTSPTGMFVFSIMLSFSQFERAMISARTKEALVHFRKRGLPAKPFFGVRWKGVKGKRIYVVQEDHYAFGLKVVQWRSDGYTLDAIRYHLKDHGIRKKCSRAVARNIGLSSKKPATREWTVRMLERVYLSTLRTTQWINSGKVLRESGVPAGEPFTENIPRSV